MISHEITQRNVWPYLIGLGLILLAFLLGWMANEVLQTAGLQVNIGSAPVVEPSTEIHAADRKFFSNNYTVSGSAPAGIGSVSDIDPADRKFFTNNYTVSGNAPAGDGSISDIDPADRKFYTNDYTASGNVPEEVGFLSDVDPADRKFYTQ
jgi:hypothetical protein